ncbi:MAG: amidohydrolase [Acidobacteriota bacterium]
MQLFENASFISCEDENQIHSVMVEENGKIIYLGKSVPEEFRDTTRCDLGGTCVVPAFADTHIHFEQFSMFLNSLDTRNANNFNDLGIMIREYIEKHPSEKIILGFGSSAHTVEEKRLPTRYDLDAITSRPVCIIKYDGHAAMANTPFLGELPSSVTTARGFDKSTGTFYQESFYRVAHHLARSVSVTKLFRDLILGTEYMAHKGIALVHTVEGVGFPLDLDVDLMRLASWGLPQQFRIYFQTMDTKKVRRRKMPRVGGCFATALDGCFGSQDAALKEPYANNSTNNGVLFYPQPTVTEFVTKANRAGLQVAMHAVGDAAVEQALCAYESALAGFPRKNHRHVIIHADVIDRAQIERAASLGIFIALQTPFLDWSLEPANYLESLIGKRMENFLPLRSLIDAGIILGNGSDAPCTFPDPIFGIHAACNHPNSDQRISPLDALRMATNWAAKISFDDREHGTLSIGKRADFVVLDQNPLDIPPGKIRNTKILDLYLSGRRYNGRDTGAAKLLMRSLKNKMLSY